MTTTQLEKAIAIYRHTSTSRTKQMTTTQLEKAIARCEREMQTQTTLLSNAIDWKRHFAMLTSKGRYCTPQELN